MLDEALGWVIAAILQNTTCYMNNKIWVYMIRRKSKQISFTFYHMKKKVSLSNWYSEKKKHKGLFWVH